MTTFKIGGATEGKFDVPAGEYVARFAGVEMLDDSQPRIGKDGKPMAPAMSWHFEITEGPAAGKTAGRITGRNPTSKNIAGRMLSAITGQWLQDGKEVSIAPYVGKLYRI